MDMLSSEIIISIAGSLTAIALVVWAIGFRRTLQRDKEIEPIVEKEIKAREERQKKLGLNIPRIPLYFDYETLKPLYSQSLLRKSLMKIDTIKKVTSNKIGQKLDAKVASTSISESMSEEYTLKQYKNTENEYESVLRWLCEQDFLTIGLEEPTDLERIIKELEKIYSKENKKFEGISEEIKNSIEQILSWKELELARNKAIFIKGDFAPAHYSDKRFHIILSNHFEIHVEGFTEYCTKKGKELFSQGQSIKASVFGYISKTHPVVHAVYIEPIAIHRLVS